jgi:hypothetical protein
MLEGEAAAYVLDAGATHAGRLIFVPADARPFGASDVVRAISGPGASARGAGVAEGGGERVAREDARPLFPAEIPRPSVVPGAEQVVSPLVPAGASVLALVSEPARLGRERIDECFKELRSELFAAAGAARSAGSPTK